MELPLPSSFGNVKKEPLLRNGVPDSMDSVVLCQPVFVESLREGASRRVGNLRLLSTP